VPVALNKDFTVAVIGAGSQGAELALLAVRAGFRTVVEDVLPSKLRSLNERLRQELDHLPESRMAFASSIEEAVRQADFAMDSVPDELESKLEIFSLLDRMAPPKTLICSPLEAVSLSDLASCTYRADKCAGVQMQGGGNFGDGDTVNLIRGTLTSETTVETAQEVWRRMGKRVEVVTEAAIPGFGA
jgi:3-hydroxybutyryl-CoA dehydrogenase